MDNKTVDLKQWKDKKYEKLELQLLESFLKEKGLEINEENIEKARYDFDFPDELKKGLNEMHLLSFINDNTGLVSYNLKEKEVILTFSDGNATKSMSIWVDVNGNLQISVKPY